LKPYLNLAYDLTCFFRVKVITQGKSIEHISLLDDILLSSLLFLSL